MSEREGSSKRKRHARDRLIYTTQQLLRDFVCCMARGNCQVFGLKGGLTPPQPVYTIVSHFCTPFVVMASAAVVTGSSSEGATTTTGGATTVVGVGGGAAVAPSLLDAAHHVLTTADPDQKAELTHAYWAAFEAGTLPIVLSSDASVPEAPARPARPSFVEERHPSKCRSGGKKATIHRYHPSPTAAAQNTPTNLTSCCSLVYGVQLGACRVLCH